MADANALQVHDINLADQPQFGPSGQVRTMKRLTFWVGSHGPFYRNYAPDEATTEKIQSDINSQVQQIRIIEGVSQSS